MSVVLDASAALAWHFGDESTPEIRQLLMHVADNGAVVPALWHYEVANGLQVAVRRRRINPSQRDLALANMAALPIKIDLGGDARIWSAVVTLADRYSLTVYDAAYLELALSRQLPLATLDNQLAKAGGLAGLSLYFSSHPANL